MGASLETYLKIVNNTNVDIGHIDVKEVDSFDWDGDGSGPKNFQAESIKARGYNKHREEVNKNAKSRMFKMILRFEDGYEIAFRADQTYAITGYSGHEFKTNYKEYSGYGKYEISRGREDGEGHGTMVITITGNQTVKNIGDDLERNSNTARSQHDFNKAREYLNRAIRENPNDKKRYSQQLEQLNSNEIKYQRLKRAQEIKAQELEAQELEAERLRYQQRNYEQARYREQTLKYELELEEQRKRELEHCEQAVKIAQQKLENDRSKQLTTQQAFASLRLINNRTSEKQSINQIIDSFKNSTNDLIRAFDSLDNLNLESQDEYPRRQHIHENVTGLVDKLLKKKFENKEQIDILSQNQYSTDINIDTSIRKVKK